jgi:dihydropteroate synthase
MQWQTSRFLIDLAHPRVMGIVNVTPDSFSDGGRHASTRAALVHCEQLLAEGADILDLGGESSRPGAPPLPVEEELARVLPVLREAVKLGVAVSVDTYKPEVMRQALTAGADIVNDIWALRQPGALDVVAAHPGCGVCLMHMHGQPHNMHRTPMDGDAVQQEGQHLRCCPSCCSEVLPCSQRAWRMRVWCGTPVSASARPSSKTSPCLHASPSC